MNDEGGAWVRWYAVMVQIVHQTRDGWSGSRQVPIFYLDAHVQGITGVEHAARVARDIMSGAGVFDTERATFHITALPADQMPQWAQTPASKSTVDSDALGQRVRHSSHLESSTGRTGLASPEDPGLSAQDSTDG